MSDEGARKRWEQIISSPFIPATLAGTNITNENRVANALEYIAAQLGQINAKLDKLIVQDDRKIRIEDIEP
jgi:hypothetical protein